MPTQKSIWSIQRIVKFYFKFQKLAQVLKTDEFEHVNAQKN